MAEAIEIRHVKETDAPALVPLFRAFFGEHFGEEVSPENVSRRLRRVSRAETFLVAAARGHVVGFTSLRVVPSIDPTPYAEVTDLFVAEASRRQGVGAALLQHCEGLARSRGAAHLVLLTGRGNREAKALYKSLGYAEYALALRKSLKE